jgi:hypothetical protein
VVSWSHGCCATTGRRLHRGIIKKLGDVAFKNTYFIWQRASWGRRLLCFVMRHRFPKCRARPGRAKNLSFFCGRLLFPPAHIIIKQENRGRICMESKQNGLVLRPAETITANGRPLLRPGWLQLLQNALSLGAH